jgi:hypothetical protein
VIVRNETFQDGVCVYAEVIDLDGGTLTVEERGVVVSSRPLTPDEVAAYTPQPDARESALAKLQALGLTEAEALALVGGTP